MTQLEIDINKRYKFPKIAETVRYAGKYLVIAPDCANWIVLGTEAQLSAFEYLKQGRTIKDALSGAFKEEDVNFVVCQIEARRLCDKETHDSIEDERSMHLYLTNKCNLRCPHCYMFSGQSNEDELTTEQLMTLIHNYKTIARGTRLTISGGEPTIRTDFQQIVKYAAGLGLNVKLLTNGALLSAVDIKRLSRYIASVQVSIDGFSEESDASVRGRGHFQKALDAIDQFVQNGVETSIAITPPYALLKQHIDDYAAFAIMLVDKYSDKNFCVKFAEGLSPGRSINPSKEENEEYARLVKSIQTRIYGLEYDFMRFVQVMSNDVVIDNCMFGVFAVASNGDVYFCPEIGKLRPVANVRKDSFHHILQKALEAERATSVTRLLPCKDCELRHICGGGCRIEEFSDIPGLVSFEGIMPGSITPRKCSPNIKDKFYDLMIRSNEYLYKP